MNGLENLSYDFITIIYPYSHDNSNNFIINDYANNINNLDISNLNNIRDYDQNLNNLDVFNMLINRIYPSDLIYLSDINYFDNYNYNLLDILHNNIIPCLYQQDITKYDYYKSMIINLRNNNFIFKDIYYSIGIYLIINELASDLEEDMDLIRSIIIKNYYDRNNLIYNFSNFLIHIHDIDNIIYDDASVKYTLSKNELDKIPNIKYNLLDDKIKTNNETCLICLQILNYNDNIRQIKCNHIYHSGCIDKWLSDFCNNCPTCRSIITSV